MSIYTGDPGYKDSQGATQSSISCLVAAFFVPVIFYLTFIPAHSQGFTVSAKINVHVQEIINVHVQEIPTLTFLA